MEYQSRWSDMTDANWELAKRLGGKPYGALCNPFVPIVWLDGSRGLFKLSQEAFEDAWTMVSAG